MRTDRKDSDGEQAMPAVVPAPRERPTKPERPRPAPPPEDDDPTMRVWLHPDPIPAAMPEAPLESSPAFVAPAASDAASSSAVRQAPVPPPLPRALKASEQTPIVAVELPSSSTARLPAPWRRYETIGAALFAGGVLVGVLGAVTVLGRRDPGSLDAAVPVASATPPAKAAALPAPRVPSVEPVQQRPDPAGVPVESLALEKEAPAPQRPVWAAELPVSGATAPSCRQLLGKSLKDRNDPKRAHTQTALANRALVRGNVKEAHAAYCLALAWDRSNVERRLNLARLYLVRRDWAKAAEHAQSALELDPTSRRALAVVGDAWAGLHKTKEARAALLSAERKPEATPAEMALIARRDLALAKRVERMRDFTLAERLYRRVLLLEPEHSGAMSGIASCLLKAGDRAAAAAWSRRAMELKRVAAGSRSG